MSYTQTFETWNKLAQAYQDKFMNLDLYNDSYDLFCSLLKKSNPTLFEIGCGPGNITKYLLAKNVDFKIQAIDVAPTMIELAKLNNPTAEFNVMDCREISKLTKKYDGIICGFCMPYLTKQDCLKLIKDASELLVIGGVFYFSLIEGKYTNSAIETSSDGQHSMFLYYHQQDYLKEALTKNMLELIELKQKLYTKSDNSTAVHSIFIARKIPR